MAKINIKKPFNPKNIQNLKLWLKADTSVIYDGSNIVSIWEDQSSNGNDFIGGSATYTPNYINGKPAIYFDGIADYLTGPSTLIDNFSEITIIGVWKIKAGSNNGIFGTSNYSDIEISIQTTPNVRIRNNDYSATFISNGWFDIDSWTISYLGAANADGEAYKNGSIVTGTNSASIELPTRTGIIYELGRYAYPEYSNLYTEMHIAEFLIYDRKLTATERQQIESYLNKKYNFEFSIPNMNITSSNRKIMNIRKDILNSKKMKVHIPTASPISLDGLKLWVSADYGVTESGGIIQSVLDKSPNSNNLSLSSGSPSLSSNIINGKPAFYFFGGKLSGINISIAKTIYAVVKIGNSSPNQYACILESSGGGLYSAILSNRWGSYFSTEIPVDDALSTNTAYIIGSISDDGFSYKFRQNGAEVKSDSNGEGFYTDRSALYFGKDSSNTQPANCYVAEVIAYNRELTTLECEEIETYLNNKYAIY